MTNKNISMLQIVCFLETARRQSFTEAARCLYTSQPSVSKQIAQLENAVGIQLFYRTKRSVRLTPAGTMLFNELSDISNRIDSALEKAKQSEAGKYGSLSIGWLEAMDTQVLLGQVINDFRRRYPDVQLYHELHSFKALREKLIDGSLDVIFTFSFDVDESLGLDYEPIIQTVSAIVISAAHPLAAKENLTLDDLKDVDFVTIARDEAPKTYDSVTALLNKNGITPRVVRHMPNIESVLLCVEAGLGYAIVDSTIRLHNSKNFRLIRLEGDVVEIVLAWKRSNSNPAIHFLISSILNKEA